MDTMIELWISIIVSITGYPYFRYGYPLRDDFRSWLFISVCIYSISADTQRKWCHYVETMWLCLDVIMALLLLFVPLRPCLHISNKFYVNSKSIVIWGVQLDSCQHTQATLKHKVICITIIHKRVGGIYRYLKSLLSVIPDLCVVGIYFRKQKHIFAFFIISQH